MPNFLIRVNSLSAYISSHIILPARTNLSNINPRSVLLTALMHTPLHTINQTLTARLSSHTATPFILLPRILRHVFPTPLFRGP